MTNADWIRNLSDEELAEYICSIYIVAAWEAKNEDKAFSDIETDVLAWLTSNAEE